MLFAEIGGSFQFVLAMALLLYGGSRAVKMISGSPVGRTAVKKGGGYLIKQLFK